MDAAVNKRSQPTDFLAKLKAQQAELEELNTPEQTAPRNDQFVDTLEPVQFPQLELEQPEMPKLPKQEETSSLLGRLWKRLGF